MATIIPQYVGAFLQRMSPPNAARSSKPCKRPKTAIAHGKVSKAKDKALSRSTVLEPDLIHRHLSLPPLYKVAYN